jgi:glucose/arabinose dehydrogenase
VQGQKYGWPFVYGNSKINPQEDPLPGTTKEQWAKESREPVMLYNPHSAPMQMLFYSSNHFPAEYAGDAFVTMRGSWNRKPPSGYEVVRIRFADGKPTKFEPFVSGFLVQEGSGWGYLGRPVGLAIARDGALLVGDDSNGVIYRVSHAGGATRSRAAEK